MFDKAITLLSKSKENPSLLVECLQARAQNELKSGHTDSAYKLAMQAMTASQKLDPKKEILDLRFAGPIYCSTDFDPATLAYTFEEIAQSYQSAKRLKDADACYALAVEYGSLWHRTFAFDPLGISTVKNVDLVRILTEYATFAFESGNKTKSRELTRTILEKLKTKQFSNSFNGYGADQLESLGELSLTRGDFAEAEDMYRQALTERGQLSEDSPGGDSFRLAYSRRYLGDALLAQKKYTEAEAEYKLAMELTRKNDSVSIETEISRSLAKLYWEQGRRKEAVHVLTTGLASNHNAENILNHRKIDYTNYEQPDEEGYEQLAKYFVELGDLPNAVKTYDAVIAVSEINGSSYSHQADIYVRQAALLRKIHQKAKAEKLENQARKFRARKDKDEEHESTLMSTGSGPGVENE